MWFKNNLVHLVFLKVSQRWREALVYLGNENVNKSFELRLVSQQDFQSFGEHAAHWASTKLDVQVLIVCRVSMDGEMLCVEPFQSL